MVDEDKSEQPSGSEADAQVSREVAREVPPQATPEKTTVADQLREAQKAEGVLRPPVSTTPPQTFPPPEEAAAGGGEVPSTPGDSPGAQETGNGDSTPSLDQGGQADQGAGSSQDQ